MINRQPREKNRSLIQPVPTQPPLPGQSQEDDVPMHRYASTLSLCRHSGVHAQLQELNLILDYQNKILVEILAALNQRNGPT